MNHKSSSGFTLIELMIVVVIIGILAAIAIPNFFSMQDRAKEEMVKGVAHTLQLAAEDWAVRHDHLYSDRQEDLLPLLPNGQMLRNAFTGEFTEPRFGAVATEPGQVGIIAVVQNDVVVGYTITGYGKLANILTLASGQ